jgi:hypothetical protein
MLRQYDDLIIDRLFQPMADLVLDRLGIDCLSLATSALIGAVVMLLLAAFAPFPFGLPSQPLNVIPVLSWGVHFCSAYWDIQEARRHRDGGMNPMRLRRRVTRITVILMLATFPPVIAFLLPATPPFDSEASTWQVVILIALFLGFLAASHYLIACERQPPQRKPAKVPRARLAAAGST